MSFKTTCRYCLFGGLVACLGAAVWVAYRVWPRTINVSLPSSLPQVELDGSRWAVKIRTGTLLADAADFESELQAFLYFEYLKSHSGMTASDIMLTASMHDGRPRYQIDLVLGNDLLSAITQVASLRAKGLIHNFQLDSYADQDVAYRRVQSDVFLDAYNPFTPPKLESLSPEQLLLPVTRFLVFKSATDGRVRQGSPLPQALSFEQAKHLAADILAVARFYQLPLDVFLGIGAMENNYMNVRGDLGHAVWKRRPQKGDIVLKRSHGRYLVCDYAMGSWQITRETLRFAHRLYLQDKRNYSALPPRLRPSKTLDLNFDLANPETLTTYAGLLLRHLLDSSGEDVQKAVGAYNKSLQNPNYQYAAGVNLVAEYARSFLERAANLNGLNVAERWITQPRPIEQIGNSEKDSLLPLPAAESSAADPSALGIRETAVIPMSPSATNSQPRNSE